LLAVLQEKSDRTEFADLAGDKTAALIKTAVFI
jgi:hypothetical protein